MAINPHPARHKTEDFGDTLRITIPSKKQWSLILFLSCWLIGWAFGEFNSLKTLFGDQGYEGTTSYMIGWLLAWTIGGVYATYLLLWLLSGKEVIEISSQGIIIGRVLLGFSFPQKEYSSEYVQDLRVSVTFRRTDIFGRSRAWEFYGMSGGLIAFDYGSKTVRFGSSIHEAEAKKIVAKISRRFPQWR
jgi:hypothetical protein